MTLYGKINLLAMIALPVTAVVAGAVFTDIGPGRPDTLAWLFGMNLVVTLFGGLFAALLLRGARKAGGPGSAIALAPSVVPAAVGSLWYLFRAVSPEEVGPGAWTLAGPQLLILSVFALWILAWIGGRVYRATKSG
ncbi:MAG: hypothetical protein FJ197_00705 [Gammaproteobacteria bacterium]|nr:hypothetical protein [Gammaproteobacteria bacterium]